MIESITAITVLIVFAIYFNYSVKLVDKINDEVTFNQLTIKQAVFKLNPFRKLTLVLCLPVVLPVGFLVYIVNLILYHNVSK